MRLTFSLYITGVEFKNMPPCKKVLYKKIQRANYLAKVMKDSNQNTIENRPESGWILNEFNELEIEYFEGSPYPEHITEISIDNLSDEEDESEDAYFSSNDESDDFDY